MKKTRTTKKPERIFPKLPDLENADREAIQAGLSHVKACGHWLLTHPAEHLVKHALEMETGLGSKSRPDMEVKLTAHLMKIEKERLQEKILRRKHSV